MQGDIVDQGLELMLYGMGTVVIFLSLLIVATTLMSRFLGRFFPEAPVQPSGATVAAPSAQSVRQDELVAVISAAVHQHRTGKK